MLSKDDFISRACPLMFGAHTRVNYPMRGWLEDDKKLPIRLRCKGFKGVLMILGTLVCITEGDGFQSFQISKVSLDELKEEKLPLFQHLIQKPVQAMIFPTFLKKK